MKLLVYFSLAVYFTFYLFEGPIRYLFNMVGMDSLIFVRDLILIFPLLVLVFLRQYIKRRTHPAFILFAMIIAIHGLVSMLNIGSIFVVIYCTKLLIAVLAGAILSSYLIKPSPGVVKVVFMFWAVTFIAIFLDKYLIEFPWTGLQTTIGDISVEISRDWQISGEDKRAAGLMRSSINAAIIEPLLAFILIFNIRSLPFRLVIMLLTSMALYWTTQKASILGFVFTCGFLLLAYRRPIPALKWSVSMAFLMMIFLPIILPQFDMPHAKGVFSLGSFYMRVEEVWPDAWHWIERKEVFPFGVGLGGIGGAMRFYAIESVNFVDNMYIFLYAYFGIFSYLYMGWLWWVCMRISNDAPKETVLALSIISFIIFYGVAMTMIEDQMAGLFFGAAVAWITSSNYSRIKYAV